MSVPNQRDPDQIEIIRSLLARVTQLEQTVTGRWGQIPHVSTDPTTPLNGAIWLRDDSPVNVRVRSGGTTYSLGGPWVTYAAALFNVTGGAVTAESKQLDMNTTLIRAYVTAGTATAASYISIGLPVTSVSTQPFTTIWAANGTNGRVLSAFVDAGGNVARLYADAVATSWGVGASVVGAMFTALVHTT